MLKVYLHFVWATKNRTPYLLNKETREVVWDHIFLNGKQKGINILIANGHKDHCHCLLQMGKDQTLSQLAQLMKGESSFWINKNQILPADNHLGKFDWQDDYYVESVSPSHIYSVFDYIQTQDIHHEEISFEEEYQKFLTEYDIRNLLLKKD